ncbi:dTDP-4-amino-4,6-dideoxygalactose transaminase [Methanohalophilus levihalophilus]|uniref:DegT/DnrJ/EryC1/StrS family aminotransferase n=1 Tax=Methanohalophilus levihalophilus TaxID=1431282 RepID=UPI001AE2FD2D|nr:DegT/DnrJ/EryC1/StrS family aminotransferase [Methanohalophilus levihalophilus]MBP2029956.1 dTDP-4-amino-4,6-dideoxygalactose transaminase [Methanohalophilus levihalophilus]
MILRKESNRANGTPPFGGIGSEFYLPTNTIFKKNHKQFYKYSSNGRRSFVSSGRDALHYAIKTLGLSIKDEVLLPSYLCEEVLKPFKDKTSFVFYKVDENLSIDLDDICSKLSERTKVILVIHYFGFPQNLSGLKEIQERNSFIIIEDVVQAFLTECNSNMIGHCADISISSYRKWIPVPDGALITFSDNGREIDSPLNSDISHRLYIALRFLGLLTKYLYVKYRISNLKPFYTYFFQKSERFLLKYSKPAKMSKITAFLLDKFNYDFIITQRRRNFKYLLYNLKNEKTIVPLFETLPEGVCPLGFPISVDDRDRLKKLLIENSVYPPIHWELPDDIDKKDFPLSWDISKHILTIPIDQRYTEEDMEYVLGLIKRKDV